MESTTIYRNNASDILSEKIFKTAGNLKDYVFLCIGTSGVVSDSLGPKVGSLLMRDDNFSVLIYGTGRKADLDPAGIDAHYAVKTVVFLTNLLNCMHFSPPFPE